VNQLNIYQTKEIFSQSFILENIIVPMKRLLKRKRSKAQKIFSMPNGSDEKMDGIPNHPAHQPSPAEAFTRAIGSISEAQKDYERRRKELLEREAETAWDRLARSSASDLERTAGKIIWLIREHERDNLFGNIASEAIPGRDTRDMGGQFLSNKDRVMKDSRLYKIAVEMPKGCHLHLHFNAELAPEILIEEARKQKNMFIRSTQPILKDTDYDETEIVFNVMPIDTPTVDLWSPDYNPAFKGDNVRPWMKWTDFQSEFRRRRNPGHNDPEEWVRAKMVLSEDEVYGLSQTTNGLVSSCLLEYTFC
jgi:adenosine deaminase CECR1